MYPAQAFVDGVIVADDLPDIVIAKGQQDSYYQVTFSKVNAPPAIYVGDTANTRIAIEYINGVPFWSAQSQDNFSGNWFGFQDTAPNSCLVFEPPTLGLAHIADDFADRYRVVAYSLQQGGGWDHVFERVSLCRWEFTPIGGEPRVLAYDDSDFFNSQHKWIANDQSEWFGIKSGFSNTPVGIYPNAAPLYPGGYIEVTEA